MFIIDKNQDYYDYLSHVYGVDKKVVYDRRGSENLTDVSLLELLFKEAFPWRVSLKESHNFLLEVGYKQYLLQVDSIKVLFQERELPQREIDIDSLIDSVKWDVKLLRVFEDNKHYYSSPMSITPCMILGGWKYTQKQVDSLVKTAPFTEVIPRLPSEKEVLKNPILKGTSITSIVTAQEMWENLQNYISSLNNDRDSGTILTDEEKAINHGFDKHSFRK